MKSRRNSIIENRFLFFGESDFHVKLQDKFHHETLMLRLPILMPSHDGKLL